MTSAKRFVLDWKSLGNLGGGGTGYGDGTGTGYGSGRGDGEGEGTGDGSGDGYGTGDGEGTGDGTGRGDGYGDGDGTGWGNGDGGAFGSGYGHGDGYGTGIGDGNGFGYSGRRGFETDGETDRLRQKLFLSVLHFVTPRGPICGITEQMTNKQAMKFLHTNPGAHVLFRTRDATLSHWIVVSCWVDEDNELVRLHPTNHRLGPIAAPTDVTYYQPEHDQGFPCSGTHDQEVGQ